MELVLHGSAGQSFGCFIVGGMRVHLTGEANDYVGKGMAGGEIVIVPPPASPFAAEEASIVGNTCLYGATGGRLFVLGRAGERFAVRNSRAEAVVEGTGDHCCEYMTGGWVDGWVGGHRGPGPGLGSLGPQLGVGSGLYEGRAPPHSFWQSCLAASRALCLRYVGTHPVGQGAPPSAAPSQPLPLARRRLAQAGAW